MKLPWLSAVLLGVKSVTALAPITAIGNKFFTPDGKQFFIKGIAYQLTEDDPLIDTEQCTRDAELMKTLGTNTIRVYHVDPKSDHTECMKVLDNAGIYALIDLDTFDTYINPNNPSWDQRQHDRYAEVMDAFITYDNVLGFFVGNEIITQHSQSAAAPFIKAATRDMKAHRDRKGHRQVPIGYSAADIAELRPMLQDYLTCGGNSSEGVDFFALNSYEWCDPSTYSTSGYANLQAEAKNFPVPIFFSETGCNVPGPRLFEDQAAIFGPEMVNDWSGAIIYEWIQEANNYGLISYGPVPPATAAEDGTNVKGGFSRRGTPTPVLPDFENLKTQWANVKPTGIEKKDYEAGKGVSTRACPTSTQGGWLINGNVKLPAVGETFKGEFTTAPSVTVAPTASPSAGSGGQQGGGEGASKKNPAPANRVVLKGMVAGLVGVMVIFLVWL
ncbi:Glucanosyltransferase-domain-containing protein [Podospora fimiseda]|uniref:1,3-beta-glucanosyltransferase n=1 Tax=Podospora fimiseda TaxID=252190 RepID=A0AAN7H596_9PEZI|nr:Glucanosyltransferase-domain-containing protein [Podospora fimiseda]